MATITINGITLDPIAQQPALAAAKLRSLDASQSDYILVQTTGPLTKDQRQQLEAQGAKILEYVPESTYVCFFESTDLKKIQALSFVSWVNPYLRAFKIHPALIPRPQPQARRNFFAAHELSESQLTREPHRVDVVLHRQADASAARNKIAAAAGVEPEDIEFSGNKARLTVPARALPLLSQLDEVHHIEPVSSKKLDNDIARGILGLGAPSANGTVFEGAGQVVAVCDTGLDKGSISKVHPAFKGRVARLYALGRHKRASDPDGHGTHVAGSVLGDGKSTKLGVRVRGTAPKAKLVLQSVLDSQGGLGGIPADLRKLFNPPYQNDGARVHTNSWSNTQGDGEYNSECAELDEFVWNHRDLVICFAAGNEGVDSDGNGQIDANSIKPPSTSKNCITVGATENNRPSQKLTYGKAWPTDFPAAPISTDKVADNPEGMVAFSSRGPTLDQRIKPDVVAPGTFILSTRSRLASSQGWGLTSDPLYFFEGGTSMATPLVAGCAVVAREFLIKEKGINKPSAALVKALLINSARNISGQYVPSEAGEIPNINEGFGRVDMAAMIASGAPNQQLTLRDEQAALDTGDEESITVDIPTGASFLKATLVWTDPPGAGLQNDLDLIVRAADGAERHGNQPANSSNFDRTNNVEQVAWQAIPAGNTTVVVKVFRVAQFPQPYALVIRVG